MRCFTHCRNLKLPFATLILKNNTMRTSAIIMWYFVSNKSLTNLLAICLDKIYDIDMTK